MLSPEAGTDAAPQRSLPGLVGLGRGVAGAYRRALAERPRGQPFGAEGDVLVEQAGQLRRQLVAHHRIGARQVAGEAGVAGGPRGVVESRDDAPAEHVRCERRFALHAGHDARDQLPQPAREVAELHVGAEAVAPRQFERQLAPHGGTGHDHLVRHEDRPLARGQALGQQGGERLVAVGEVDGEHVAARGGWGIVGAGRIGGPRLSRCLVERSTFSTQGGDGLAGGILGQARTVRGSTILANKNSATNDVPASIGGNFDHISPF